MTVLPPGEWDPSIRIEPPTSLPSQVPAHSDPNIDGDDGNTLLVSDDKGSRSLLHSMLLAHSLSFPFREALTLPKWPVLVNSGLFSKRNRGKQNSSKKDQTGGPREVCQKTEILPI